MNKKEHGAALRAAMSRKGIGNQELATALGVNLKTVGNWRRGETMPSPHDLLRLETLFPGYRLATTDPVLAALTASPLVEWRRQAVLAEYQRHLYEQGRELPA